MNQWKIAFNSLRHYWRNNLAIAFGAAIATAVLTGALIVGDSMRSSLRSLMLEQLGQIDEILISDGFFRESFAEEIVASLNLNPSGNDTSGPKFTPVILFPNGTVETELDSDQINRAANVNIMGIRDSFWKFSTLPSPAPPSIDDEEVIINQALADELGGVQIGQTLTLRVPKPSQLPSESALGAKDDLVDSIVDLTITKILPNKGLARFSLRPSQVSGPNLFIKIDRLQESLARGVLKSRSEKKLCNAIFFSGLQRSADSLTAQQMEQHLRPTLEDIGLNLKRVTRKFDEEDLVFDYWSLSSEKLVFTNAIDAGIAQAFPQSKPVLTYLANDIRRPGDESGVPFSMIAAVDVDDDLRLMSAETGQPIAPLKAGEIVLNQWAVEDLGVRIGDPIEVTYFEPETTHGNQTESAAVFTLVDIATLTEPQTPYRVRRRRVIDATFDQRPTLANDPDLTPTVPGVTDAESIENWDLPFATAGKIRAQDDDYWNYHRTTPKGFVALSVGQRLWASRFGKTTSYRIQPDDPGFDQTAISGKLLQTFADQNTDLGLRIIPIKQNSLVAAAGSTPFDVLFLALSMFVIMSALILVALLFRLAVQSRIAEIGLLQAVGLPQKSIMQIWIREMGFVCFAGAALGLAIGIGYAQLMVYGLTTWWVGAISTPFLTLSVSAQSLAIGLLSGGVVCLLTIWWSLRSVGRQPVRSALAGQVESVSVSGRREKGQNGAGRKRVGTKVGPLLTALVGLAIGLIVFAFQLSGDAQAGALMGSGFLVLFAGLLGVFRWLKHGDDRQISVLKINKLALLNAKRNPARSALTIGLVSVASFLIIAVSAFRLSPSERGTGGFEFVATSSRPIFSDLNNPVAQAELLGDDRLDPEIKIFSMRLKPGQDASCNNLFQATQPRVIGVPDDFIEHFAGGDGSDGQSTPQFGWAGAITQTPEQQKNPWQVLRRQTVQTGTDRPVPADDSPIACVIDKNTANYSLKIFAPGTIYQVQFDSGETVKFEVVGFLENTILQGSLLIGERDFKRAFPAVAGYRYFLVDQGGASPETAAGNMAMLESQLGDQGFDAKGAISLLTNFMAVQNTYLNTFQSLGGLGLLLGTLGLAAVQIRSVLERTQELGLMRAIGFGRSRIGNLIFLENGWLMLMGLGIGVFAALFSTLPRFVFGTASVPWFALAVIFGLIVVVGASASYLAARIVQNRPVLSSLRDQ